MISHNPKFIFIHVPKSAGSSIEAALSDYSADTISFENNGNAILPGKHMSSSKMIQSLGRQKWLSYYSFAVARNPWERVVSNFFYLKSINHGRTSGCENVHEWVMQNKVWCRPICHYVVYNGKLAVTKIIRFDSLEKDFNEVCNTIGITPPCLQRLNRSQHSNYTKYYNNLSRDAVAKLFRADIQRFSFEYE